MAEPRPLRYAVLHVVPRAEREEWMNVGVIVYDPAARELAIRVTDDLSPLAVLAADVDLDAVRRSLISVAAVCAGRPDGGPASAEPAKVRFGHLTAPRSTMLRASVTHGMLAADLESAADQLFERYVRRTESARNGERTGPEQVVRVDSSAAEGQR